MLRLFSVCLFAVLAVFSSTSANAQTFDQRTYFTFSQPVALPGVTLPAPFFQLLIVDFNQRPEAFFPISIALKPESPQFITNTLKPCFMRISMSVGLAG